MKSIYILLVLFIFFTGCVIKITKQPVNITPITPVSAIKPVEEIKVEPVVIANVQPLDMNTTRAEAGKEIYNAKCGRCHELKNEQDFTVEEWKPIIERMALKAGLDSAGKANITLYINNHAKKE